MKIHCSKKQRGSVVVVVTIALPILLLIMGLALDFAHVFVNKTRLQNALDATALSAAIAINRDINKNKGDATKAGKDTFNCFIGTPLSGCVTPGNGELKNLNANDLIFEYSKKLNDADFTANNTVPPTFVRVKSIGMLNITPVLIKIMSQFNKPIVVPAVATAGAVGNNCSLMPFVICPKTGVTPGCDDMGCNGVPFHTKVCLKSDSKPGDLCTNTGLTPNGNFGLIGIDGGSTSGSEIRNLLNGTIPSSCSTIGSWKGAGGVKAGPVAQGINDRIANDKVHTEYTTKDGYLSPFPSGGYYSDYDGKTTTAIANGTVGIAYNRVMAVPVVDTCAKDVVPNIIAASCFLLTENMKQGKDDEVIGELTHSCYTAKDFSPTEATLNGPYKIVLFKSPASGDS